MMTMLTQSTAGTAHFYRLFTATTFLFHPHFTATVIMSGDTLLHSRASVLHLIA